jgi:hypothetical protein
MTSVFASAADAIYRTLGVPAVYESTEDGESTVRVIVSHDLTQWGDVISVQNNMAMVSVRRSEIADRPRRGDTFTLEVSRVYLVERVMRSDDLEHRCLVVEDDD